MAPRRNFPSVCDCGQVAWMRSGPKHVILVDAADEGVLRDTPWSVVSIGYAYAGGGRTKGPRSLHRLLTGAPDGLTVDHKNRHRSDCRRGNLRICSQAENLCNRPKWGTSPFKGVKARNGRWVALIKVSGRDRWLGTFDLPEEAARAYDAAASQTHGEFAFLNFPQAA